MNRELLIEIGCEEIPASWLPSLTTQLENKLRAALDDARLTCGTEPEAFATPRRLVARVAKLEDRQTDLEETQTGPALAAAFDAGGKPTRAAEGFARKHGVPVNQLIQVKSELFPIV